MAVFFTSDTHFGDHRTLNIHKRPFASVAETDAELERGGTPQSGPTTKCGTSATSRGEKRAAEMFPRLAGRKRLIVVNNDAAAILSLSWEWVGPYAEIELSGVFLVLCQYPLRSWNRQHRRAVNLHGHSHGRLKPLLRQLDVGVDGAGFAPLRLDQVLTRIGLRKL